MQRTFSSPKARRWRKSTARTSIISWRSTADAVVVAPAVAKNLLQSSFTNFCPLEMILKKIGVGRRSGTPGYAEPALSITIFRSRHEARRLIRVVASAVSAEIAADRSEEHTSELQSHSFISYAV